MKNITVKNCILLGIFIISTSPGQEILSFEHDGIERTFQVHTPAVDQTGLPLVFGLQGYGSSAEYMELLTVLHTVAEDSGLDVITVYPEAVGYIWNSGIDDNPFSPTPDVDDVGFFNALIDTMYAWYEIDTNRVYSCGMSNGGFMSYRLACELSDRITAVASVTGSMASSIYNSCSPTRPIPVMKIHGTADFVVPYGGSFGWMSIPEVIYYWTEQNDCQDAVVVEELPDIDPTDFSTVDKLTYGGCEDDVEVVLFDVIDGGHQWPGAPISNGLGAQNMDITASFEILNFFLQFPASTGSLASGDLDQNGETSLSDLVYLVWLILGVYEQEDIHLQTGDLNFDGTLNIADVLLFTDVFLGSD